MGTHIEYLDRLLEGFAELDVDGSGVLSIDLMAKVIHACTGATVPPPMNEEEIHVVLQAFLNEEGTGVDYKQYLVGVFGADGETVVDRSIGGVTSPASGAQVQTSPPPNPKPATVTPRKVRADTGDSQSEMTPDSTPEVQSLDIEDQYCKSICHELFVLLGPDSSKLVKESAFRAVRCSISAMLPYAANFEVKGTETARGDIDGKISEGVWNAWMVNVLAALGRENFVAACRQSAMDLRSTLPQADVPALSPWFDLDLTALGKSSIRIEDVEHRAITVGQLKDLEAFFMSQADSAGVLTGWWDRFHQTFEIRVDKLNLYQLSDWVINPATAPHQCSFVELIAKEPQPTTWFVSHWWGEPVRDFIACVANHAHVRNLPDNSTYWVCAYANNQHELGRDLGKDPSKSSFARALGIADGVLLILDVEGPATPFTRVWCCFEEAVTVLHLGSRQAAAPLMLDIAAVADGNSQLLTDGLVEKETEMEKEHESKLWRPSGWDRKSEREAAFPTAMIQKGLTIDIEKAEASEAIDKTRILNCIAGRTEEELDNPYEENHPMYRAVNRGLAGIFAAAAWRSAIADRADMSDGGCLPLLRALREDGLRKELTLHLSGLGAQFANKDLDDLCANLPKQLSTMNLNFAKCKFLTSLAGLGEGLRGVGALTTLRLNFRECSEIKSLAELGEGLRGLEALTTLSLDFLGCSGLTSLVELGEGLRGLGALTTLSLDFTLCSEIKSLAGLGEGLRSMGVLATLHLDFDYCCEIKSLAGLGEGLRGLGALTTLSLDFGGCSEIKSLAGLGEGLRGLGGLTALSLDFGGCSEIKSLAELGEGLCGLGALADLYLDLRCCSGLPQDAEETLRQDLAGLSECHKGIHF